MLPTRNDGEPSGFLAVGGGTAGVVAAVWQAIEVAAGMAIYLPFMKAYERAQAKMLADSEEEAA